MAKVVSPDDKQLIVTLANGDEVLLTLMDRSLGGQEVTVTMTNGQTVADCFWRVSMSAKIESNENKVTKLIRFVHDRNRPAYYRALDVFRPYLPNWIVNMNGYLMFALLGSLPVIAWGLYYVFGRGAMPFMFPISLVVVALTLGFDDQVIDETVDFNALESAARLMLGAKQA